MMYKEIIQTRSSPCRIAVPLLLHVPIPKPWVIAFNYLLTINKVQFYPVFLPVISKSTISTDALFQVSLTLLRVKWFLLV